MKASKILRAISVLVVVVMLLTACGGGGDTAADNGGGSASSEGNTSSGGDAGNEGSSGNGGDTTTEETKVEPPTATPEPTIPDILVVHPDATDIEITAATNTYVYIIPGMVAEAMEYFQAELAARGWEELGRPTVMGHLATLNMQQEGYRLTVSMQDNEHSETTRIQMLLLEQ